MKIRLHQMLHGYDNGHNYIKGSIYLPSSKDMDTIANLSDWSEYVNKKDDSSYLSAYPLDETGYYVLSRTWYADEMKRPGCVWTHSILIHCSVMRYVGDYRVMDDLFRRPSNFEFDGYDSIIEFDPSATGDKKFLSSLKNANGIAVIIRNLLVGNKQSLLEVEANSETNRKLCLMIMNVLPSNVLFLKSFCSGTNALRVLNGRLFDVQFTQMTNPLVKSILECDENIGQAYQYSSLCVQNEVLSFGKLVRLFEDEISVDSHRYETFCKLIYLLNTNQEERNDRKDTYYDMIHLISNSYPAKDEGKLVKSKFFSSSVSSIFLTDTEFLRYFCTLKDSAFVDSSTLELQSRVERLANESDHVGYIKLLEGLLDDSYINNMGIELLSESKKYLKEADLSYLINEKWSCYLSLVSMCPELLNTNGWSHIRKKQIIELLAVFRNEKVIDAFSYWDLLLKLLITENVDANHFITNILHNKCKDYSLKLLDYYNERSQSPINVYLLAPCSSNPKEFCNWINGKVIIRKDLAIYISKMVDPASISAKSITAQGWQSLLGIPEPMPLQFYVFMYILSFNWERDAFAMEFLRQSFYPLHKAISNGDLSDEAWNCIMPYTIPLPLWQSWDKCKRMRKMVVKRVKNVGLMDDYLKTYTPDGKLNENLVVMWGDC